MLSELLAEDPGATIADYLSMVDEVQAIATAVDQPIINTKREPMRFIPILYSEPMVQAILEGRKTVTRRIIKPIPSTEPYYAKLLTPLQKRLGQYWSYVAEGKFEKRSFRCPYGEPGDILWGRETTIPHNLRERSFFYRADRVYQRPSGEWSGKPIFHEDTKWTPSIFMPRIACRIFQRIVEINPEPLHLITPDDAINEGIEMRDTLYSRERHYRNYQTKGFTTAPVLSYRTLWEKINGADSWNSNPWVWRIRTETLTHTPENFLPC